MNCREAERLIDTFYDGELDGRSMRDAAMHITRCKRCEAELNQRERVQQLLSGTIEREIADVDLDRIWAAVEPTLEQRTGRIFRLPWSDGAKVAAASTRVGGLLLGRPAADEDDEDSIAWTAGEARSHGRWRWTLGAGVALAASVLLAIALVPSVEQPTPGGRVALETGASTTAAQTNSSPRVVAQRPLATAGGFDVARAGAARPARTANKQVQVESVNFPRSSVAMWSEPATDTTVIWIGDEELAASGGR